jgi:hypothetical protein
MGAGPALPERVACDHPGRLSLTLPGPFVICWSARSVVCRVNGGQRSREVVSFPEVSTLPPTRNTRIQLNDDLVPDRPPIDPNDEEGLLLSAESVSPRPDRPASRHATRDASGSGEAARRSFERRTRASRRTISGYVDSLHTATTIAKRPCG